jgi:hypothetical protein
MRGESLVEENRVEDDDVMAGEPADPFSELMPRYGS